MASDHPGVAVRRVRRGPDAWVLAVSGELSQRSAGLVSGAVSAALANSGRVLVDVSGLWVTWPPAVGLFGSILAGMGGWPGVRLVLFGADAGLAGSLAAQGVSATVPVAPDETTARQLLDRRPRVLARHLDLEQPRSATWRARTFVRAACADWQLDDLRDDATIVASELVDNAVLHAGPGYRLTLRLRAAAPRDPRRHRSLVGVDAPIGQQIQLRVEQLSIQFVTRQSSPAAFTEDTQYHFGTLHFAYLPVFGVRSPVPLGPVDGLPVLPGRS